MTTEGSVPDAYTRLRIVHATSVKSGNFATQNALVKYTEEATEAALNALFQKATALQADGIIGVQIAVSTPSETPTVTAYGTAIKFIPKQP